MGHGGEINRAAGGRVALLERPVERDFGPEFAVLRLGADPALAGLLPRMRFDLRDTPTAVTDLVDGRPAGPSLLEPEVAAAVGAAIGAWHGGSAHYAHRFRTAPVAWPLLFGDPLVILADDDDLGANIASAVAGDPVLRGALGALRREWSPTTVIHGDVQGETAVLGADPDGCGGARVVLTGWGRSGLGDPAWDAGSLLAELLAAALEAGQASDGEPAMSSALAAYGRTAGMPATPAGFARRIALAVVARLVAKAYEAARDRDTTDDTKAGRDRELLGLARSVAAWVPNWTLRFEQWLGEPHERVRSEAEMRSRAAHPANGIS